MTELDLYKQFFRAWQDLEAMPKKKGPPSLEQKAAKELLGQCADAIKRHVPGVQEPVVDRAAQEYRSLFAQVAAIPPVDTRNMKPRDAELKR